MSTDDNAAELRAEIRALLPVRKDGAFSPAEEQAVEDAAWFVEKRYHLTKVYNHQVNIRVLRVVVGVGGDVSLAGRMLHISATKVTRCIGSMSALKTVNDLGSLHSMVQRETWALMFHALRRTREALRLSSAKSASGIASSLLDSVLQLERMHAAEKKETIPAVKKALPALAEVEKEAWEIQREVAQRRADKRAEVDEAEEAVEEIPASDSEEAA